VKATVYYDDDVGERDVGAYEMRYVADRMKDAMDALRTLETICDDWQSDHASEVRAMYDRLRDMRGALINEAKRTPE